MTGIVGNTDTGRPDSGGLSELSGAPSQFGLTGGGAAARPRLKLVEGAGQDDADKE